MENRNFLLDLGGDAFGGSTPSPIFSNGFDSNTWLSNIQFTFIDYLESRVAITNIINKIGGNVAQVNWYIPVSYNLLWNDLKNETFIGTRKQRLKDIDNYQVRCVVRLDVIGDVADGIIIGVEEKHLEYAQVVANSFQAFEDRNVQVPPIDILFPSGYSSTTAERILYRDLQSLSSGKTTVISILFVVRNESDWMTYLASEKGMSAIIAWLSEVYDSIVKLEKEQCVE